NACCQPNTADLESQTVHVLWVPLPFFRDFDYQIQRHSGAQKAPNIATGALSNGPQLRATFADDDPLLAIPLNIDFSVNIGDGVLTGFSFTFDHFSYNYRKRMRKFIKDVLECSLTNQLSNHNVVGFVSDIAIRIQRW